MPNVIWAPLFICCILSIFGVEGLPDLYHSMLIGVGLLFAELLLWGIYRVLRNYL